MATGTNPKPAGKQRENLGAVRAFIEQKDPQLVVFRDIGDRARGTVVGAKMVDTEVAGQQKRNAAGGQKQHLQVYLTSPEGEKLVVNFQSQNAKASLADALDKANVTGLAVGDYLTHEYVGDDEQIREGLNAARRFETVITPGE